MPNENVYETSARRLKAQKLAAHFQSRGIKSEHLAKMHPNIIAHHLMAAGISGASEETLGEVHKMLKYGEKAKASQPADPFSGLS
jgi:hypothetical protein